MIKNEKLNNTLTKLINDSKDELIFWQPLSECSDIFKPILGENTSPLFQSMLGETTLEERSYYYKNKNAVFLLIAKGSLGTALGGGFKLSLYIQLNNSKYSRLLANTSTEESDDAKEISIALRRLHNIIESIDPDYDDKIDDFLNDFLNN
jgi:hypothetical protein